MTQLNLNLPIIGDPNATEDPKIATALSEIQTVVNSLDNTNISNSANINGSKLGDATVAGAKLTTNAVNTSNIVDGAVTAAKLGAAAVIAGKLSLQTFQATGSQNTGTGAQTLVSQASVPPGTYLVIGTLIPQVGLDPRAELSSLDFFASAGTATFQQQSLSSLIFGDDGASEPVNHFAIATVTATATIALRANKNSRGITGSLILVGVAS